MTEPRQCPVCETAPTACTCPPDEGGEKPCLHCGTTGWDCLDGLNRPDGQHCCGPCPMISGHKRPTPDAVPTSGGVPLTDEYVQALADEAEQGYDVPTLLARLRERDEAQDGTRPARRPTTLQDIRERVARMTPEESKAALAYARRVELQMLSDRFATIRWTTRRYRPLRAQHGGNG